MADVSTPVGFNLIDEPWILVEAEAGRVEPASISEVLTKAHLIREIRGDIPTQVFAIARLLLAILHRALDGPANIGEWERLWRRGSLPDDEIRGYLEQHRERFDLFHMTAPFYQVADLRTDKGEVKPVSLLIADVPKEERRFFTTRSGSALSSLSAGEAARWLVHCQAFDVSGIKSGAVGDPRVKGGKGYPIGTGWCGNLGGVLVGGTNLVQTLLLNLTADDWGRMNRCSLDLPVWERPPQSAAEEVEGGRPPMGAVDLYTWQSRRIRLHGDHNGVSGVLICNGDRLESANLHEVESMTGWRRSENQQRKLKLDRVFMPRSHDPARSLWRGLPALLAGSTQGSSTTEALQPLVLEWVETLRDEGALLPDFEVDMRALGLRYGTQNASIEDSIDDSLRLVIAVLAGPNRPLAQQVVEAVGDADKAASALGKLAANIAEAQGGDRAPAAAAAREWAYTEFDGPFRWWVSEIRNDDDPMFRRRQWQETCVGTTRSLGQRLVGRASPAAWVGREKGTRYLDVGVAEVWFQSELAKNFPLAVRREAGAS